MNNEKLTCNERVVWQDIELNVPREWEMLRWGMDYERGVCVFWDRTDDRLQLSWQRQADAPDFERLLSDLQSREEAAHAEDPEQHPAAEWFALPALGAWHGRVMRQAGELTTRAACYVPESRTMLEVGIRWGAERLPALEADLLLRIRVLSPQTRRTWCAMGIHAEVPCDLKLAACRCVPGVVAWRFQDRRGRRTAAMERLAFPSMQITTTVQDWLARQLPARFRPVRSSVAPSVHPHRAAPAGDPHRVEWIESRCIPSLDPIAWRVRRVDSAMLCAEEARLYHWSAQACRGAVPDISLGCICEKNKTGSENG